MFLLLDLWELSVSFFRLFTEQMSVHSKSSEVLIAETKAQSCTLGAESPRCWERVLARGCPKATGLAPAPAAPGLITSEVLLALLLALLAH